MSAFLSHFFQDELGATAIEYGLIAGGIAIAVVSTVYNLGSSINATLYGKITGAMT